MKFNCLRRIPVYIHSANIPISLHFLSRHSWHFLRMYISITQLPPFLHLYTAFLVMLLLKKPVEETQKGVKMLLTMSTQKNTLALPCPGVFSWAPGDHPGNPWADCWQRYCIIQEAAVFHFSLQDKDTVELQPLLRKTLVFKIEYFHYNFTGGQLGAGVL